MDKLCANARKDRNANAREDRKRCAYPKFLYVSWIRWESLGDNKECQFSLSCETLFFVQ